MSRQNSALQSPRKRAVKKTTKDKNLPRIGTFKEAEPFMQLNPFIVRGYRLNHHTIRQCLKSMFSLHNESVNIWSHFAGVVFFVFCIYYLVTKMHPPVVDNGLSIFARWTDYQSTFNDSHICAAEVATDFCEQQSQLLLNEVLANELLSQELKRPKKLFYHLNHHHEAFERLEAYLRHVFLVFAEPRKHLQYCTTCLS